MPTLTESIDELLLAPTLSIFSTPPSPNQSATYPFEAEYNAALWGGGAADFIAEGGGLTGIGWYCSLSLYGRPTPITTQHIITTQHGRCQVGDTLAWILEDGTIVERTVIDERNHICGRGWEDDFWIGFLDEELPAEIPIASLLEPDLYSATAFNMEGKPLIWVNGNNQNRLLVGDAHLSGDKCYVQYSTSALRQPYWEAVEAGDSGSPVYAVLGDTFIYMTNLTQGGGTSGSGPLAVSRMTEIEDAVDSLNTAQSTTHELTLVTPDEFEEVPDEALDDPFDRSISLGLGLNF